MLTVSEIAVTATTWVLTVAGWFFTVRAAVRKKKLKAEPHSDGNAQTGAAHHKD